MLTVLLAFCAGVVAAFATMRSALRRFILEQAAEQRWEAFCAAAGYDTVSAASAGGTRDAAGPRTPRATPRLTPHDPMRVTITVKR